MSLNDEVQNLKTQMDTIEQLLRNKLGFFDSIQFSNDVADRLNKTFENHLEKTLQSFNKDISEISSNMQYVSEYIDTFATSFADLVANKIMKKIKEKAINDN